MIPILSLRECPSLERPLRKNKEEGIIMKKKISNIIMVVLIAAILTTGVCIALSLQENPEESLLGSDFNGEAFMGMLFLFNFESNSIKGTFFC